jgi:hypothetical protein
VTPERLAELQARATRPRRTVPVVCNGDLAQRIDATQAELLALDAEDAAPNRRLSTRSAASRATELEAELDALYAQAEDDTLLVVVEGMDGTAWRALLGQYPPRARAEGEPPALGFDSVCDRFAMEEPLIRACVVGFRADQDAEVQPLPGGTLDWLIGFVTAEQRDTLFVASWAVCRGDDAVPLRQRRSTTLRSVEGSPPPALSVSRPAGSTAGSRRRSTSTSTATGT